MNQPTTQRLELVDALRGFALLAIILLHNLEHYNLYFIPENMPMWLKTLDRGLWDVSWFVMAGKAYATFSLLFGFSFYIQQRNQEAKGRGFGGRFAWRMLMLILFAQFHAIFYNGDILLMYALMGLVLIPVSRLSNKAVLIIAGLLLLQPLEWWRVIEASTNPDYSSSIHVWLSDFATKSIEVMKSGNLPQTIASNLTDGQLFNNLWQVSAGRLFQIPALFMLGMLLGRLSCFVKSERSVKFWAQTAVISVVMLVLPLNLLKNYANELVGESARGFYDAIIGSFWNFTLMAVLVSTFSLLWFYKGNGYKIQRFIIPFGKMSLTNYILQSLIGCAIYLNWGLGLYEHTGATLSLLIGVVIFVAQLWFSRWWLSTHRQGPLEWVWKKR